MKFMIVLSGLWAVFSACEYKQTQNPLILANAILAAIAFALGIFVMYLESGDVVIPSDPEPVDLTPAYDYDALVDLYCGIYDRSDDETDTILFHHHYKDIINIPFTPEQLLKLVGEMS